jgi:hypothetical protein
MRVSVTMIYNNPYDLYNMMGLAKVLLEPMHLLMIAMVCSIAGATIWLIQCIPSVPLEEIDQQSAYKDN